MKGNVVSEGNVVPRQLFWKEWSGKGSVMGRGCITWHTTGAKARGVVGTVL